MTLSEADIAAIRAAIEEDAAAVRRADWDAVVRMFTADAIRFPPHQSPIRGRVAMRAWLGTFPPIQQFTISADEIVGCDDVAFVRGRGNYMGLLRKQPDGSWLWTTDMISSELPAAQ